MISFFAALAVSGIASPLIVAQLRAMKQKQVISQHLGESHQAKAGTPNMGGLIVLLAVVVACLVDLQNPGMEAEAGLVLALGFGLVGFLDDFVVPRMKKGSRGINWMPKLALQVGVGVFGPLIAGYRDPISLGILLFFILFYCNAYNFSDGLDALAGSLGLLLAATLAVASVWAGQSPLIPLALCAGLAVFLYWNKPKAKVFMGDTGSLPIGALLAFSGFMVSHPPTAELSLVSLFNPAFGAFAVLSLVMIAELVPVPLQILWVKVFKKRLFPMTPIHHAFEKAGWPERWIVVLFAWVQLGVALVSLGLYRGALL